MRSAQVIVASFLTVIFTGCIPSLYPLYTETELTYVPDLIGSWEESSEGGENDIWKFEQTDSVTYALTYFEDSVPAPFEAHVLTLGKNLFIDIRPERPESANDLQKALLLPVHLFGRLSLTKDTLTIGWLDGDWLKRKMESETVSLSHTLIDSDLLLTASPQELQSFVLKHLDDADAFPVSTYSRVGE